MAIALFAVANSLSAQTPVPKRATGTDAERANVEKIAQEWLTLIDSGNNDQAWRSLSRSTTAAVAQDKWQAAVAQQREQVGLPQGRQLKLTHLLTKEQTGRGEDFYQVEFDAVSLTRGAMREVVRLTADSSGAWQVAGYFIAQRRPGEAEED